MSGVFAYESSEVDWCEDNYKHSENVVEYFNTMSSFVFFVVSPIMLYLFHPYARERNLAVHLVWFMMIFVGLFSVYFHMTLSYVGQLLDEISILWVLAIGYALWFPRRHFPFFVKDRSSFSRMVLVITVVTTLSSFIKPTANAYALNCFAIHILYSLGLQMRSCTDRRAVRVAQVSVGLWVLAIACWVSDRHILIVVATAYGSTLIAFLDASYEIPHSLPNLQYWPRDNWVLGLPYIALQGSPKTHKRC
ncbi:hypothetical protein COCON_G00060070 [Conger conger]|uniref:Alkaline ceramidase n=1 Tax=Conger conger TaxID=82655 RepID=A0A9Q1DRA7_CONCO|nr:hypothetical protein COCON_G00060070 [Conger conger]